METTADNLDKEAADDRAAADDLYQSADTKERQAVDTRAEAIRLRDEQTRAEAVERDAEAARR